MFIYIFILKLIFNEKKKQLEGNDEGPFAKLKLLCHVETNSVDQKYMMSRGKNDTSSPTLT